MNTKRIVFWIMVVSLIVWIGSGIIASTVDVPDGDLPWISLYVSGPAGLVCILAVVTSFVLRLRRK